MEINPFGIKNSQEESKESVRVNFPSDYWGKLSPPWLWRGEVKLLFNFWQYWGEPDLFQEHLYTFARRFKILISGDLPGGAVVKNPPAGAGDTGSIPDPGRSYMQWSN